MASVYSGNTIKTSGTNMTNIFEQIFTSANNTLPLEQAQYVDFNTIPLAVVLAMQDAGKISGEIYNDLLTSASDINNNVSVEHHKQAAKIYDYFGKKHLFRQIKGEHISEYMLAVNQLCENRRHINVKHLPILITLPRIYNQNRTLERIMKNRKSAQKSEYYIQWNEEVEFVEKIHIKRGAINEINYYFSTPDNYLMRIVVKKDEYGEAAWNTLASAGKLFINSESVSACRIKGYDFFVLQPAMPVEIKIV